MRTRKIYPRRNNCQSISELLAQLYDNSLGLKPGIFTTYLESRIELLIKLTEKQGCTTEEWLKGYNMALSEDKSSVEHLT